MMRFYYQDDEERVSTKCIRVASTATTADVIYSLIEKFRPDLRMLSRSQYGLYEVHVNGGRNYFVFGFFISNKLVIFEEVIKTIKKQCFRNNLKFLIIFVLYIFVLLSLLILWCSTSSFQMLVNVFTAAAVITSTLQPSLLAAALEVHIFAYVTSLSTQRHTQMHVPWGQCVKIDLDGKILFTTYTCIVLFSRGILDIQIQLVY